MKVNIFLRIVNGRGIMRSMKSAISATSRRKTCVPILLAPFSGRIESDRYGKEQHC